MIGSANELNGFYMMGTLVVNGLSALYCVKYVLTPMNSGFFVKILLSFTESSFHQGNR